jgi:hypothetical protein
MALLKRLFRGAVLLGAALAEGSDEREAARWPGDALRRGTHQALPPGRCRAICSGLSFDLEERGWRS